MTHFICSHWNSSGNIHTEASRILIQSTVYKGQKRRKNSQRSTAVSVAYFGVSIENTMKTLFLIALVVFLVGSLTQAANVPEDLLQSANEPKGQDKVELLNDEGFEDYLSEDDAPDVEEEDEGDLEDEGATDDEDFDDEEDPER